jgi:coxsackievirus/adenovirus receptor
VCGSDGKTYSNECELQVKVPCVTNLTKVANGPCSDIINESLTAIDNECQGICAEIYFPVCGSDGKTYSNECELQINVPCVKNLTKSSNGPCNNTNRNDCVGICPALYSPVCGSNGVTYSNDCELQLAATCANVTEVAKGPCNDTTSVTSVSSILFIAFVCFYSSFFYY